MINNHNIKFLLRYGSKSTLHDIVDNHGLSGSMINNIGNNPNADPIIGSKIKKNEGFLYPHHHNLYEPSREFEDTLLNNTAIESYLDHPKHSEDDLIRLGEKYRHHGITFRPKNAGKKVFDHMVSRKNKNFAYDLAEFSSNKDIHEAVFNDNFEGNRGLKYRLGWNTRVDPDLHIKLLDDPHDGKTYANDMIVKSYLHPRVAEAALTKFPDLSSQFFLHHGWDRDRFKKAFEIIDAHQKNLYQDTHKEFLE